MASPSLINKLKSHPLSAVGDYFLIYSQLASISESSLLYSSFAHIFLSTRRINT